MRSPWCRAGTVRFGEVKFDGFCVFVVHAVRVQIVKVQTTRLRRHLIDAELGIIVHSIVARGSALG